MQVHSVLESLQQGILICDQHSRIVFFNQVYSDFIGVPLETAKGHKITEYRKSAIAPEVIWSGISVEGMVRREGTQEYFASVYPIWEEHQIRGSISIVTSLSQTCFSWDIPSTFSPGSGRKSFRQISSPRWVCESPC